MAAIHYLDFDLSIEPIPRARARYRARVLNSPAGQASVEFKLPFKPIELENYILKMGRTRQGMRGLHSPEGKAAQEFGRKLYEAIFQDQVRECLRSSLAMIYRQPDQGLRIRLRLTDAQALADIPWEYLYDPSFSRFFVHSKSTPIVRYLDLPQSLKPLTVQLPLHVLVMISSPRDAPPLDVEAEWLKMHEALTDLVQKGLVTITRLEKATLSTLQRQLRHQQFHIFHFIGHGSFDQQTQEGVLLLEDENGLVHIVGGDRLSALLHDHRSLRLIVLNACEGARTAHRDPFAGVAQRLIQQEIPAVIAMQFEISDRAAKTLAHEFYAALADGEPVDAALAEARKAIYTTNDVEWGTPVLYLRSADGILFDIRDVSSKDKSEQTDQSIAQLNQNEQVLTALESTQDQPPELASIQPPTLHDYYRELSTCPSCGVTISSSAKFCSSCGRPLQSTFSEDEVELEQALPEQGQFSTPVSEYTEIIPKQETTLSLSDIRAQLLDTIRQHYKVYETVLPLVDRPRPQKSKRQSSQTSQSPLRASTGKQKTIKSKPNTPLELNIPQVISLHVLKGHDKQVNSVAFSPDGSLLVSGAGGFFMGEMPLRLWRVMEGKKVRMLNGHTDTVWSVAFSPDGRTLASASGTSDKTIKLWRVTDGRLRRTITGHTAAICSVVFSPDGNLLASGEDSTTIRLWQVGDGQLRRTITGHTDFVKSVAFSPDGRILASEGNDSTTRLWQVENGNQLHVLKGDTTAAVKSVAFSPDGRILASGGNDNTIRLWHVTNGQLIHTIKGHTGAVRSVAFSPDGHMLASGGDDATIRLWHVADGQLIYMIREYISWVRCVVFSPDGTMLASGSDDKTVRIWQLISKKMQPQGKTHTEQA